MAKLKPEALEPETHHLRPMSLDKLLDAPLPPKKLIMEPWLPEKGLALVYGHRGVGKTHFVVGAALAIASGTEFLGWSTPRPRRVVVVDGEMAATDLQQRFKQAVRFQANKRPLPSFLRIIAADLQPNGIRDLATDEGQTALNAAALNADVIILDNLSTLCSANGKENEADSWSSMQSWALSMKRDGKSVIFVHHAGKNGDQRGTSRREDILDTVVRLERPADYSASQGARFKVKFEKARGFRGGDARSFEASLTAKGWIRDTSEEEFAEKVRELSAAGKTQRKIAEILETSASKVNRTLKEGKPK